MVGFAGCSVWGVAAGAVHEHENVCGCGCKWQYVHVGGSLDRLFCQRKQGGVGEGVGGGNQQGVHRLTHVACWTIHIGTWMVKLHEARRESGTASR